jgi:nicotinate phosphoribosyltransferase
LLVPVMRGGKLLGPFADGAETIEVARMRAQRELARLHPSIRRLLNPHQYPVGIDVGLHERRDQLIREMRWDFAEQA